MSHFEPFEDRAPLILDNVQFNSYSYILLPYVPRGTVLDLLMKANKLER